MFSQFGLVLNIIYILSLDLPDAFAQLSCSKDDITLKWNEFGEKDVESWRLCSDIPPKDAKLWPSVGNGHVATVVHSNAVYMNGLYNGNGTQSTRARIPAATSLNVSNINLPYIKKSYCLQMDNGIYVETYTGDHWNMELKVYAHRTLSRLLVTELTVEANGNHSRLYVTVDVNKGNTSEEIDFVSEPSGIPDTRYMHGFTKVPETSGSGRTPVHVYYSSIPNNVVIEAGITAAVRHTFLMSVGPDKDETKSYYKQGGALVANKTLESTHMDAWHAVWDAGRVDIYGNPYLSSLTYSSLYYILSAMPTVEEKTWPFVGLSPADLAHNGYNGHIFWDQDTWMFPPILVLNSDLGKTLVNTRLRVLDSAKEYARQTSYEGARFPWEGALSGFDVTPSKACGKYEIHISGDVAVAFQQYIMMTKDLQVLKEDRLEEAVFDFAEFWLSRSKNNTYLDTVEIQDVMPPDEYHFPVNNSVYTNFIAQKSLRLPAYVCELTGCQVSPRYEEVASKIKIPFDDTLQYHPEYDGYNSSIIVKQADAILLGWPLEMNMSTQIRRNDLEIYAKVTPAGPAMSWGMFTIGWIELGEYDKANETFYEQLKNRRDPFNIWTEDADGGGTTNFITGMGGYLHSLIFGYAGVRFGKNSLTVNCSPFPKTSSYRLKDIDYVGNSLDITCNQDSTKLTLTGGSGRLRVTLSASGQTIDLEIGKPVCVRRQKMTITAMTTVPVSNNPTQLTTPLTTVSGSNNPTQPTTPLTTVPAPNNPTQPATSLTTAKDASSSFSTSLLWTCFISFLVALTHALV